MTPSLPRAQLRARYPRIRRTDDQVEAEALRLLSRSWRHPSVSTLARELGVGLPRMRRIIENSDHFYTQDGRSLLRLGYGPYITGLINRHGQDTFTINEYAAYVYVWENR